MNVFLLKHPKHQLKLLLPYKFPFPFLSLQVVELLLSYLKQAALFEDSGIVLIANNPTMR